MRNDTKRLGYRDTLSWPQTLKHNFETIQLRPTDFPKFLQEVHTQQQQPSTPQSPKLTHTVSLSQTDCRFHISGGTCTSTNHQEGVPTPTLQVHQGIIIIIIIIVARIEITSLMQVAITRKLSELLISLHRKKDTKHKQRVSNQQETTSKATNPHTPTTLPA